MKICLTGELFGAKEAFDMGLVSEVVPDAEVGARSEMAQQIAALAPLAQCSDQGGDTRRTGRLSRDRSQT
jgi:enoyl-CoA hydratase/carnithine racemase